MKEAGDVLEKIKRAGSEEYATEWTAEGKIGVQKKKSNITRGKKSKSRGNAFEVVVRKDLEEKGFVVDKWSNNIDVQSKKVISARRVFNPFKKVMTIGTGFPDFIAIKSVGNGFFQVIGVEVKVNGTLSREEKEKLQVYDKEGVFSDIWVASKVKEKNRVRVTYTEFSDIEKRMRK